MATGTLTISAVTIPSTGLGGDAGARASNRLAVALLQQIEQQIGASGATSGSVIYPPGSATVVATWTYSPSS